MPQTFAQAKKVLARYAAAYDLADIGEAINTAVDELASSSNWQKMRRTRKFYAYGGVFPLPQECEAAIRASIDGKPVDVRGLDYDFLFSGPGDLDYVEAGYAPTHGLQDLGYFPTMYPVNEADGVKLCAFGEDSLSGESIKVTGIGVNGDVITEDIYFATWSETTGTDGLTYATVAAAVASKQSFTEVTRVVLPAGVTKHVSLYYIKDGVFYFLSRMHPSIRVPEFRRYRIPGFSSTADAYYRVMVEVKMRALPLIAEADILPFDSLLPVQYMLQSLCSMNSGEIKTADDYRQRAVMALAARENIQQERQGLVIMNTQYDDSLGELSATVYQNI